AAALDVAAVERNVVADRHLVFENRRVRAVGDVDEGAVLYVGALADAYVEHVAANDRAEPDGGLRADVNVPDDLRALLYEGGRVNLRALAAERSNHNSTPEGADGEARVFPPKAKTVARAASTGQESRRPTLGPTRGMRPRRSRRTTRARPAAAGVLQSPAPTRRPEGDRESRADEHPAPVLPADPEIGRAH